jgi:ABC-type glycerol-3-phosphate transport system substrate-binding protein
MYAKAVFDKVPFANEIKVLPVTEGPAKVRLQGAGGHNFYLFKGVRNRDAAIGMITHMLSVDVQAFLWQASPGYVVPAFKNPWEDPRVRKDDNAVRFESITWAEPPFRGLAHPGPLSAAVDAVGSDNVLTDMMGQILKGKKVEDAVKEAHDRATKIFKEFGLKGE